MLLMPLFVIQEPFNVQDALTTMIVQDLKMKIEEDVIQILECVLCALIMSVIPLKSLIVILFLVAQGVLVMKTVLSL